jgi:hypothetical protein
MKYFITTLLLIASLASVTAQDIFKSVPVQTVEDQEISGECIFMDSDQKICYVDLEKIPHNLRQAVLIDAHGDEVLSKNLVNMRVNSIVELDYRHLPSGSYLLELRSYTGKSHKAIRL